MIKSPRLSVEPKPHSVIRNRKFFHVDTSTILLFSVLKTSLSSMSFIRAHVSSLAKAYPCGTEKLKK